jgi:hypothetical protein
MTLQDVLTVALDFAYLAVLVVAVGEYRRRREPVGLAVVAVFVAVFVVFAASTVGQLLPAIQALTGIAAFVAFIALPVLTINLVGHFQPVPAWLLRTSAVVAILFGVGGLLAVSRLAPEIGTGPTLTLVLASLFFFLILELVAASAFVREARRRSGASRTRLAIAAFATALLALAALLMLLGGIGSGSDDITVGSVFRMLALLAAFGYLVAFQPPGFVHRFGQQATAYEFVRRLNALPTGGAADDIWRLLAQISADSIGARAAAVAVREEDGRVRRITVGDWPVDGSGAPSDPRTL